MSYQKANTELEKILQDLQEGNIPLDKLAATLKKASSLIKECKTKLRDVEKALADFEQED